MSLITLPNAAILYGCDTNNFSAMLHYNNSINRKTPWMVIENGNYFIDTFLYERQSVILNRCWAVNTEYLYWLMMDIFKTETKISKYLTEKSNIYNSESSWIGFIKVGMFNTISVIKSDLRPTQQTDFTRIAVRAIAIAIKNNIEIGKDFE